MQVSMTVHNLFVRSECYTKCRASKEAEKEAIAAAKAKRLEAMQERLAAWQASQHSS